MGVYAVSVVAVFALLLAALFLAAVVVCAHWGRRWNEQQRADAAKHEEGPE